jgi:hypothetical protein
MYSKYTEVLKMLAYCNEVIRLLGSSLNTSNIRKKLHTRYTLAMKTQPVVSMMMSMKTQRISSKNKTLFYILWF